MSTFIKEKVDYKVKELLTQESIDEFAAKKLSMVFLVDQNDEQNKKVFASICANYDTIDCGLVFNKDFLPV